MPRRIAVYSPDGMDKANHILRESDRENNNGSRSDKDSFHPPTERVYFEITSTTRNSRRRYPGVRKELNLLEDINGSADFWTTSDTIEVIVRDSVAPTIGTLYEGRVVGTTHNTLSPVVVLINMCCGDPADVSVSDGTPIDGNAIVFYVDVNPRCSGNVIIYDRYWIVLWIAGGVLMKQVFDHDPYA